MRFVRLFVLASALGLAACSSGDTTPVQNDGGTVDAELDAAVDIDGEILADMNVSGDTSMPLDMMTAPDMTLAPDAATSCDAGFMLIGGACLPAVPLAQQAYVKASNTFKFYAFGEKLALSGDGSTLAVASIMESSNATGVGGDQDDQSVEGAGAVYVFVRDGTTWRQEAYVKASNTGEWDVFGTDLELSYDGSTLVVGASGEWSSATGVGGNQFDNSAESAGAAYVFERTAGVWAQTAYLKASNTGEGDIFGDAVAISADGSTIAVGARWEASGSRGVNPSGANDDAYAAGAVYVFTRSSATWSQQAYLKASNADGNDNFGWALALSADGSRLAVSAAFESGAARGVGGDQNDNTAEDAGAVYVFARSSGAWSQEAYIKASNADAGDAFGWSVALSADGATLAVGAYDEAGGTRGIGGDRNDNGAAGAGAAYVFTRTGSTWTESAYIKGSNTEAGDRFGRAVALSAAGDKLLVGSAESSAATGLGGNQLDNAARYAGAAYLFVREGGAWSQRTYIKASNTDEDDDFAEALAMSADGYTFAIGAPDEDSAATGIGGDQNDDSQFRAGATYVFYGTP